MATLAVEDGLLAYAVRQGLLVLAVGHQVMEIENAVDFEPKRWRV